MTYRNTFIKDHLSVFYADGQHPLGLWSKQGKGGCIKRVWDSDISMFAVEITGPNVSTCSIETTRPLGVSAHFFTAILKNLNKYLTFEIMIRDNFGFRRRLRFSNFQAKARLSTFDCVVPLCLNKTEPWNLVRVDLSHLTLQAFGSVYTETLKITIHANCRVRRVYFSKFLAPKLQLPDEFSLIPKTRTKTKRLEKPGQVTEELKMLTPPPSIDLSFIESGQFDEGEDMDFRDLPIIHSTSTSEGAQEGDATYTFQLPRSPAKTIGTQTMQEYFQLSPEIQLQEPAVEIYPEKSELSFGFSDKSSSVEDSYINEILGKFSE